MEKFDLFAKYGVDKKKERDGVPFYLDKESDCYIILARWTARNVDLQREMAEITANKDSISEQELEKQRLESFTRHLVKGWNNIYDQDGVEIPFTFANAFDLLDKVPDLVDELVAFSLDRKNYPLDKVEKVAKN